MRSLLFPYLCISSRHSGTELSFGSMTDEGGLKYFAELDQNCLLHELRA